MTRSRTVLLLACLAFAPQACGHHETWRFTLARGEGGATIDMDRVTVIFEGVPLPQPESGVTGGASGALVVAGSGTHAHTVRMGDKTFVTTYADGVNTMTFAGYTLVLRKGGTWIEINDMQFDLAHGKHTIVVAKDGTPRVKDG